MIEAERTRVVVVMEEAKLWEVTDTYWMITLMPAGRIGADKGDRSKGV